MNNENHKINAEYFFSSPIYMIENLDFLEAVNEVGEEELAKVKNQIKLNDVYPVYMSANYYNDQRISDFANYVGTTAWNILNDQGYDMQNFILRYSEMWTQEHYKHSSMEQHVHSNSHIVGFYFLETPENCSRLVVHDTRAGKIMSDLPQKDMNQATHASQMINFVPSPGLLVFLPGWLPHSFTRHVDDQPIKFVHFNLYAEFSTQQIVATDNIAEVI